MLNQTNPKLIAGLLAIILAVGIGSVSLLSYSNSLDIQSVDANGFTETQRMIGFFTVEVARNGEIVSTQTFQNQVVNLGLECVGDLIFGTSICTGETTFNFISVGTAVIAPVEGDTNLGAESVTCARVQDASPSMNTATSGERLVTLSAIFTGASCVGDVFGEVGIHDALTTGNMYATSLLPNTVELFQAGDTLTVTYSVQLES